EDDDRLRDGQHEGQLSVTCLDRMLLQFHYFNDNETVGTLIASSVRSLSTDDGDVLLLCDLCELRKSDKDEDDKFYGRSKVKGRKLHLKLGNHTKKQRKFEVAY
ncbi:hypothetical protein Tco_0511224, partial [Tanacetum coccineum]